MIIYQYESECYKCKGKVTYYTYLIFHEYDLDVEFPVDMSMVRRVYAEMPSHKDNPYFDAESYALNFPVKVLGDDADFDKDVIDSGKFPNIRMASSRQSHKMYAANHCPYCGAFLGNYHLREQVTDRYLRPNIPMIKFIEI